MSKVFAVVGFALYLVLGIYLLNFPFNFIPIPEFVSKINVWILFAAGVLVIINGIKYLLSSNRYHPVY